MRRYRTGTESFAVRLPWCKLGRTNVWVRAATFGRARARATIPAPPFPRGLTWVNVAPLRMDQAEGPARARRVLGLLPRQLAAHAAVPEGVARALRGRRASRHGGPHGGFEPSRDEAEVAGRRRRLGIEYPVVIDTELESGTSTGSRAGRAGTCGTPSGGCSPCTTARAATRRPSSRSRSCSASSARPLAPVRPRTSRAAPARADRGPARRLLRPLRGGGVWAVLSGRGTLEVGGRADRDRPPRLPSARAAPAPHRGRARAVDRRRARVPHDLLHAGGASSRCPRSPSSLTRRGGRRRRRTTATPGQ